MTPVFTDRVYGPCILSVYLVYTDLKCYIAYGGILYDGLITNLLLSVSVKEI